MKKSIVSYILSVICIIASTTLYGQQFKARGDSGPHLGKPAGSLLTNFVCEVIRVISN